MWDLFFFCEVCDVFGYSIHRDGKVFQGAERSMCREQYVQSPQKFQDCHHLVRLRRQCPLRNRSFYCAWHSVWLLFKELQQIFAKRQ